VTSPDFQTKKHTESGTQELTKKRAKKKFGHKRRKTDKGRTCYDVYVQLEDDAVTVYSGTPGGHATKGTKLAKKSRHVRGDAGALNLECGESGAARRFGCVWS
jgi:hypothetical protein